MIKLLIGGSPCTSWSIAQSKNRETTAEGIGWELFRNYLIAREKYQPDYFLYENNKSMAKAIRNQIDVEFCRPYDESPYWVLVWEQCSKDGHCASWRYRHIEGYEKTISRILINSALVSAQNRQRYYWTDIPGVEQPEDRGIFLRDILDGTHVNDQEGKARTIKAQYAKTSIANVTYTASYGATMAAEPVKVCNINGGGLGGNGQGFYAKPVRVGDIGAVPLIVPEATKKGLVEILPGECVDMAMISSKTRRGRKMTAKSNCLTTSCQMFEYCGTVDKPIYEVRDGRINIKGEWYEIKLVDGFYIIRKLTVLECMRLQTVPDAYTFPVSDTQAYKMLGNGWTCDVIAHILSHAPEITTEPLEMLSMYDGMSCGHIALDKLGADVVRYYATEIDKYAIKTTMHNYPDTIQLGDAFQVRENGWTLEMPKPPEDTN
jgi:Site-specific DNA methylase